MAGPLTCERMGAAGYIPASLIGTLLYIGRRQRTTYIDESYNQKSDLDAEYRDIKSQRTFSNVLCIYLNQLP